MISVCVDTNVVLRMRGSSGDFRPLWLALTSGQLAWVVSTEILLEYEELLVARGGSDRWQSLWTLMQLISHRFGTIPLVDPQFRFSVITVDPDDNKFVDCAIVANADFIITEEAHFKPLATAGYKPQAITPVSFIQDWLGK